MGLLILPPLSKEGPLTIPDGGNSLQAVLQSVVWRKGGGEEMTSGLPAKIIYQ